MNLSAHNLYGRTILLIISGGISAYKSLDLIRRLKEKGAHLRCILTSGSQQFITPLAVSALSEEKVFTDLFSLTDEQEMGHIRLARNCDLVLVAPASANLISRVAQGQADDLAATVLLATDKPIIICPAMNPAMWTNSITQDNISTLKKRGINILNPASGGMACGEHGEGQLPEVAEIVNSVTAHFLNNLPLKNLKALVTSGPTHEPIDPVRFIGNNSSGKQGHAIAEALALAGADVTLISGPVHISDPRFVKTIHVQTADEMLEQSLKALPADIAICVAAVADYKPAQRADVKIKKEASQSLNLDLVQNPDILATICLQEKRPRLVIGFAAETNADITKAKQKMQRKGCDWLILNDVSEGQVFGQDDNQITLINQNDSKTWEKMSKKEIARKLVDEIQKINPRS